MRSGVGAGARGRLRDFVLEDAVDGDGDGTVAADDVAGIPLAGGFFAVRGRVGANRCFGCWVERFGEGGAGHGDEVAGGFVLELDLEAERPGAILGAGGDVDEKAAVAGLGGPAPLGVERVIFVGRGGGEVAHGFAGHGEGAVGVVAADVGDGGRGGRERDEFPAGEIPAVEKIGRGDAQGGEEEERGG